MQRLADYMHEKGSPLNTARKRMALFPVGSEVISSEDTWVPIVRVENVYSLPGVPWLFKQLMQAHAERFVGEPLLREELFCDVLEADLADGLAAIHDGHPLVSIGVYLNTDFKDLSYRTKVALDTRDEEQLASATAAVKQLLRETAAAAEGVEGGATDC
eukprot:PLAT6120.1.p2 GENE.PLAT6120.1~~PLAT6120.1.p2  ORF type:complete len:159 (+),score=73.65 PLAT6120.1:487-963(+)